MSAPGDGSAAVPSEPRRTDWKIEVCNDCDGLVGWTRTDTLTKYVGNCCPGGVICKREKGVRALTVEEVGKARAALAAAGRSTGENDDG